MLRLLRKKKTMKRILWVMAILIVPAFVLWGAGSSTRSKYAGPSYLGKIRGRKVTFKKFAKSYEACYHQLILSSGGNPELLRKLKDSTNINQMAWQRLIMLEEAKRHHIEITDKEIIEMVTSSPLFKRNGIFDKRLYDYILNGTLRIRPRDFEEEIRESLMITKLRNKILEGIYVSEDEALEKYKKDNEKIKISFVLINIEDFTKDIQLDEEDLRAFYEKNMKDFQKGDEINIRYFYIEADNTDLLYRITEDVHNNKIFENIAEENKLEIKETGLFGRNEEIPGIGWSYELIKVAFELKENMTSFPIYAQEGYYVISVKEKRSGYIPSFKEIESILSGKLTKIKSNTLAEEDASRIYKEMREALAQGDSFERIAKKMGLKIEEREPFSRLAYIEGIGQAESLKEAAFNLPEGEINPPVECGRGFVILRVDKFIPADETKFEKEKDAIEERLLTQKRFEAFNEWFEELSKNIELKVNLDLLPL